MKILLPQAAALILLLFSTSFAQEEFPCFSLKGSTTCPAFQNFYISIYGNKQRYPFLNNVTDISSFDAALRNYVISPELYLSKLGCTNKAAQTSIPYARYSLTFMCASLIQDNLYSLPCNYQNNQSPPPLCQSTCFGYTTSVDSITNNLDMCPNQLEQAGQMASLNSTCQYWSGLNGTYNCIIGMANEPDNCGFSSVTSACQYCQVNGTTDACCRTMDGCRSLSVGAIIGIILGCLLFTAIVGAIVYWFCCFKNKKKKNHQGVSYNGFMMNQKHEIHDDNDSSSVLGYESLASQGALVPQPAAVPTPQLPQPPPPPPMINTTPNTTLEEFYQVKHPYPPQMGDELGLHVGDIVCVAMNFDDGWALGFNVTTGLKGVFPIVCVTSLPEELLEQLLFQQESTAANTKTLVEDGSKMHQICENLRRSISISSKRTINTLPTSELTQHSNIPRRTASIMRSNYDYRESDSPTSPTLNTPFFDVLYPTPTTSVSQPEPALFHQPIETYEMHRKNNRVSKLEQE
jgi:hypothetical protein